METPSAHAFGGADDNSCSAKVFNMPDVESGDKAGDWKAATLRDIRKTLVDRPWSRDMFLRGSLAKGSEDSESDIDLVVTVAEDQFEAAIHDLSCTLPQSLPGWLPPWLDVIVRDFGGVGFVYLLQIGKQAWGQLDIYLLPRGRRRRLFEHELVRSLWSRDDLDVAEDLVAENVDAARRRYGQWAIRDLQQAVLGCYVGMFLLRKRLLRGDRFQIFSDTYATAQCVRDFVVLACYPDRPEHGWHGLPEVIARSPDPALVLKALSTFAQQDVELAGLSDRVARLQDLVAMLAPGIWREDGEALQNLGQYLPGSTDQALRAKPSPGRLTA
jgi:predicted nucleotidyltransferase